MLLPFGCLQQRNVASLFEPSHTLLMFTFDRACCLSPFLQLVTQTITQLAPQDLDEQISVVPAQFEPTPTPETYHNVPSPCFCWPCLAHKLQFLLLHVNSWC